jgi:outer membrane protein TolC
LPAAACALALATAVVVVPGAATAVGAETLGRDDVLALARVRALEIVAAQARERSAEGRLVAARTWRYNPELELEGGPRSRAGEKTTWDRSLTLSQRLDLSGRGDRIAAAEAAREAVADERRVTEIAVLADAAALYLRALHAEKRRTLADSASDLHERLRDIARRRRKAGEIGALEENLAAVAAARARAVLARAAADVESAHGSLAELLVLDDLGAMTLAGDLTWPVLVDVDSLRAAIARHPQVTALTARRAEATAEIGAARAERIPKIAVFGGAGREEGADLLYFGVGIGLPIFARGQGETQIARARHAIAEAEAVAAPTILAARVERAWQRHRRLQEALASFDAVAADAVAANVRLAEESYRLGKIGLGQVLVVQREHLDALGELVDLRLQTALAAVELAVAAALPPLTGRGESAARSE